MGRLRYDNSVGTLGTALGGLVGDTVVNFQAAPAWATLAQGDYIPLVIDPPGASPNGNYEVVYVTAYTAGDTHATIKRGQEGTVRVAHANGAVWMVAATKHDIPGHIVVPKMLLTFGHSYAQGNGLTNSGFQKNNRQSTRLAQALGAQETNYGVGGSCLCFENSSGVTGVAATGGWPTILQKFAPTLGSPYLTPLGAVLLEYGVNDYCMFDTGAHFQTVFQAVLQGVVDRLRCAKIFEDTDASVTYPSGSWSTSTFSSGTVNSGTTMHSSNATVATVQIALPADYNGEALVFGVVLNGGAPAPWSTVAACSIAATDHLGTNIGNLDMKAIWVAFNNATTNHHNPMATLRVPAGTLPAGAQNITLTYTNPGANSLWFDWWGIEADVPPPIILEAPFRLPTAGYTALGPSSSRPYTIDDTGIANILASLHAVAAIYTDGRVFVADGADAIINKQAAYITSDNVHPNPAGTGIVAQYNFSALANFLFDNPTDALRTQNSQAAKPSIATAAKAYQTTLTSPFINGWNKINVDTIIHDDGGNMDLTNHRYVCPTDGIYDATGQLLLANQASDSNYLALYVNGTRLSDGICTRTSVGATGTLWALTVHARFKCKAGDYIELFFNTANTTAAFESGGDAANDYLDVVRVE